ncbi:hypothetical protein [Oceanobacillus timonensis]|uniref:hypothetical protein n=1 Tax=Oceanobacillus timonensis TaxID=1926285 RepID=UPI0009BB8B61|nr:hypothetical protein [Oceanobacillus timonensis]
MTPVTTPALARPGAALTRPIENICASQGELKIHLKSGLLFKLAEAVPMESGGLGRSGSYTPYPVQKAKDDLTRSKHDNRDHVHSETGRFICLFLGAKVELLGKKDYDFLVL